MRTTRVARSLCWIALIIFTVRCAATIAPRQWLAPVEKAGSDAFGGWIELWQAPEGRKSEGELIAVAPDRLFVHTSAGLSEISLATISRAVLTGYEPDTRRTNAWIAGGAVSTVTHGVWLLVTLPAWFWTGAFATNETLRKVEIRFPSSPWQDFEKYARFPQGLPSNVDPRSLQGKNTKR